MSVTPSPTPPTARPGPARRIVVWLLLVVAVAALAWLLATRADDLFTANDFVEYWAASRLNRAGRNPYDAGQLLALQRSVGWTEELALMMWNPPWALPLVTPFGWLPYEPARTAWVLALIAMVVLASYLSWEVYDGAPRRHPLALIPAFLFVPTLAALNLGQISPLILLGVVGFLSAAKRGRWALAGSCAVLLSLKPHLLYLFWPVFFLWCLQERRWRALASCALTTLALTGIALSRNPSLLAQYVHTATSEPPFHYMSSALGTILRLRWGWGRHWLQFAPSAVGLAWGLWYWTRHRHDWDWRTHLPLLLLVSVATTAYGWTHDLVVLVPVLIQAIIWASSSRRAPPWIVGVGLFVAINAGALAITVLMRGDASWDQLWWMPGTLLLAYVSLRKTVTRVTPAAMSDKR